jgi:hypothetical protein
MLFLMRVIFCHISIVFLILTTCIMQISLISSGARQLIYLYVLVTNFHCSISHWSFAFLILNAL